MDARDEDDTRGCDDGIRDRLGLDADGAGRATGRSPVDGPAGSVVAPPGGLAMGCSGLTGRPPSPGGGTTTTPGG